MSNSQSSATPEEFDGVVTSRNGMVNIFVTIEQILFQHDAALCCRDIHHPVPAGHNSFANFVHRRAFNDHAKTTNTDGSHIFDAHKNLLTLKLTVIGEQGLEPSDSLSLTTTSYLYIMTSCLTNSEATPYICLQKERLDSNNHIIAHDQGLERWNFTDLLRRQQHLHKSGYTYEVKH